MAVLTACFYKNAKNGTLFPFVLFVRMCEVKDETFDVRESLKRKLFLCQMVPDFSVVIIFFH